MIRDLDMFEEPALGFALVPERLDGHAARLDEEAAREADEAEAQNQYDQLQHDAFCHGADPLGLLSDGLWLVFGFGEFDVFHVVGIVVGVVVFVAAIGGGASVLLAGEAAGAFASVHDVRSVEGLGLSNGQGEAIDLSVGVYLSTRSIFRL